MCIDRQTKLSDTVEVRTLFRFAIASQRWLTWVLFSPRFAGLRITVYRRLILEGTGVYADQYPKYPSNTFFSSPGRMSGELLSYPRRRRARAQKL